MAENPWNPWRALRDRAHLVLEWGLLDTPGMIVRESARTVIWLDARLRQRDRNATLAHELIHDERGLLYTSATPQRLIDKEEAIVRREVARRLVPTSVLDELAASGEQVTLRDIAERLDVPEEVAEIAVGLWARSGTRSEGVP